jgi:phage terminase large subunit-like protein
MGVSIPNRLIRTRSDEVAIEQGCYFDSTSADRVKQFFEKFLRHSKGQFAGKKFELLDWQWERVIEPLFGWKMSDGTRRFRKCAIAVPKKNGKSTLLAGVGLYLLTKDNEPGAEIYVAAGSKKQASIIFDEAANMVEASDALTGRIKPRRAVKEMDYPKTLSTFTALSAEAYTKEGPNSSGTLFDELHAQPDDKLWNVLAFAGASRRQPLLFWISTAGVDREGICYRQWRIAKDVQESKAVDISLLPLIYEAEEKDDPWSEDTWRKVNPSYGITINKREMQEAADAARADPATENSFRRYRLNQWTRSESKWISSERWDACRADYTEADLRGLKCWAALDLATTTDINALVLLFKVGLKYRVLPFFWVPEAALRGRERSNRQRIDHWAAKGLIKLTSGNSVDYGVIRADINALADEYRIREVALDPWNATSLATDLMGDGFHVEYVRQGYYSINAATKEFEKLVVNGLLEHNGNPVLDWMFSNITIETDAAGCIKPSKSRSADKIDGIVSTIIALARAIKQEQPKKSVYDKRGVQTL